VGNSVTVFKNLKNKITEFETFETAEEYLDFLDKQPGLKQLAQVPFTLSLLLTILPQLKRK
jgi:hypothetical protein